MNSAEGPVMDRCERMSIRYRGGYSFSFKRPKYFGSACQVVTVVIALRNVAMNGYFCLGELSHSYAARMLLKVPIQTNFPCVLNFGGAKHTACILPNHNGSEKYCFHVRALRLWRRYNDLKLSF